MGTNFLNGNETKKKSVRNFEKWYPSKAPSMNFEDPEMMNERMSIFMARNCPVV